jgi:hypothetical protein
VDLFIARVERWFELGDEILLINIYQAKLKDLEKRLKYEKEEGRLQGQIDLLKEIKSMRDKFAVESEGDKFILGFLKRKMKTEKVV